MPRALGIEVNMKALDIVQTPKGGIALVTETSHRGSKVAIVWLGPHTGERNAWWRDDELKVVNSLPRVLAKILAHPMGNGREDVERFFPLECKTDDRERS